MKWRTGEVVVIINQDSSQAQKKRKSIDSILKRHNLNAIFVKGPDTESAVVKALKSKRLSRLIIGGGDGSVRVAASKISTHNPKVSLGIIPIGTANYYVKSLGVSRSLAKAFEVALGTETEARHLVNANGHKFLLGLNVGYTSHMFREVTKAEKKRFGRMAYVRGIFRVLRKISPPRITITVDGKSETYSTSEVAVLNQNPVGLMPMFPKVKGSEASFEIITYGLGDSKLAPLFAFSIFVLSLGHNQKYLKRISATQATIDSAKPQSFAIDGDIKGETPLKISLVKKPVFFTKAKSVK